MKSSSFSIEARGINIGNFASQSLGFGRANIRQFRKHLAVLTQLVHLQKEAIDLDQGSQALIIVAHLHEISFRRSLWAFAVQFEQRLRQMLNESGGHVQKRTISIGLHSRFGVIKMGKPPDLGDLLLVFSYERLNIRS